MRNLIFENAEGDENRTNKLNKLADKHNRAGIQTWVDDVGGSFILTTEYTTVNAGGTIVIDKTNNDFEYKESTKTLYIYEDGTYRFEVIAGVILTATNVLEVSIFVNGVEYSPYAHSIAQGRGSGKPAMIIILATMDLKEGDELQLRAKVDTNETIQTSGHNTTIEKQIFG